MGIRIAYQQVMSAPSDSEWLATLNNMIIKNLELVKPPEVEVDFQVLKKGLSHFEAFWNTYTNFVEHREVLEGIIQAEKDGYDAVMICCFLDPVLKQARQAVNIPVVGAGEACMFLAAMMGWKFGVVSVSPQTCYDMEENIRKYGLSLRSVPPQPIPANAREQMIAVYDAQHEVEAFKTAAQALIKVGAEVILPGCMVMAPVMRLAPGCEDLPNGVEEVDGVPVMDVVGTQLLVTYALASLKQAGSAWISRSGVYGFPTPKALKNVQEVLPYEGPGIFRWRPILQEAAGVSEGNGGEGMS